MSDLELLKDISEQILESINKVERRFSSIQIPGDFLKDDDGIDRLDGIALMLITIGENLKRFEKYGGRSLMNEHPEIDWKGAIGVRDFLSHHYFDLDAELIYNICEDHISDLRSAIKGILVRLREKLNN
ncbi:MAG: DUF86 domain-containing protein [Candidatus Aegiribacteria sp.]|nr:DUF86 domain-containing protein [Candidatus Aegiribacteria sp.]